MTAAPPPPAPPPRGEGPGAQGGEAARGEAAPRAVGGGRAAAAPGRDPGRLLGRHADQRRPRPRLGLGDWQRPGDARPDWHARREGDRPLGAGARGRRRGPARWSRSASLSRPPVPPDLNAALERHYPPRRRRQRDAGPGGPQGAHHRPTGTCATWSSSRRARLASATPAGPPCGIRSGRRRSTGPASRWRPS